MQVKLVSITQPLVKTKEGDRFLTPEEFIIWVARISNPSNQLNLETAPKLVNYLIKNSHWSPMETVDISFEVKTSRGIAAQILRHRSANFQEYSLRYSEAQEFEPIELRLQGKTNRQVGDETIVDEELETIIKTHVFNSKGLYDKLIKRGIAKEVCRFVLPMNTQTTMFFKNNIRGWIHYLQLRLSRHTQKEHRQIAEEIKKIFIENFPNISTALNDFKDIQ